MSPLYPLGVTILVGILLFASLVPIVMAFERWAKNRNGTSLLAVAGSIILFLSILVLFALSYSRMVSSGPVTEFQKPISGAFRANFRTSVA